MHHNSSNQIAPYLVCVYVHYMDENKNKTSRNDIWKMARHIHFSLFFFPHRCTVLAKGLLSVSIHTVSSVLLHLNTVNTPTRPLAILSSHCYTSSKALFSCSSFTRFSLPANGSLVWNSISLHAEVVHNLFFCKYSVLMPGARCSILGYRFTEVTEKACWRGSRCGMLEGRIWNFPTFAL